MIQIDLHLPAFFRYDAAATGLRSMQAHPKAPVHPGRGRALTTLAAVASLGATLFVCSALAQAPLSFSPHTGARARIGEGEVRRDRPSDSKREVVYGRSVPLAAGDVGGATIEPSGQVDSPRP